MFADVLGQKTCLVGSRYPNVSIGRNFLEEWHQQLFLFPLQKAVSEKTSDFHVTFFTVFRSI